MHRAPIAVVAAIALCSCVQTTAQDYVVIDTGQSLCYDDTGTEITCPTEGSPFHGQDAQYHGIQPTYVDHGDGTITDTNTGLMWQQTPDFVNKSTHAQALGGAASFNLAGHTDWRLPSIKELYSLIDFRGIDPSGWAGTDTSLLTPFIDTAYFDFAYGDESVGDRIIDAQYWSSTEYVSTTMNGDATAFGVNFADGRIKGYPTQPIGPPGQQFTKSSFVRYVRGNTAFALNNFVDNGDGTVTDRATNLMWQQDDSAAGLSWQQALAYAEDLTLAGHDDWRLPNAKELQALVDYTRSPDTTASPAIDPIFNTSPIVDEGGASNYPFFWASTTDANMSASPGQWGAYVAFGEALGWMQPPTGGPYVLMDVHGAGAQRSDPKSGDPANWPNGNGPQGDVVRIFNYVRVVRDVVQEPESVPTVGEWGLAAFALLILTAGSLMSSRPGYHPSH